MKLKKLSLFAAAGALVPTSGFSVCNRQQPAFLPRSAVVLREKQELNAIDEMCIENVAEFCLQEQCDVEQYEALVNQLQDQRDFMINHVVKVEHLLKRLKGVNVPDYDAEEVQELFTNIKKTLEAEGLPKGAQKS